MLLAIDCGNTNTVFSIWNGTGFVATWRIATDHKRTADEYFVWFSSLMAMTKTEAQITDQQGQEGRGEADFGNLAMAIIRDDEVDLLQSDSRLGEVIQFDRLEFHLDPGLLGDHLLNFFYDGGRRDVLTGKQQHRQHQEQQRNGASKEPVSKPLPGRVRRFLFRQGVHLIFLFSYAVGNIL